MKEGEIEGKDGNKFKVYWPKGKPFDPTNHGITEEGVEGCCPVGPLGTKGVSGVPMPEPKTPTLKEMLNKYLYGTPHYPAPAIIPIDDSLEKDVVESPVKGRIYKIRQINVIARYRGTHLVTADEGDFQQVAYETTFRDMTLFVCKGDLLRATEAEVATFLEK